jgi:3-oxoacyl-[acyl-carrier-protein] synthase II
MTRMFLGAALMALGEARIEELADLRRVGAVIGTGPVLPERLDHEGLADVAPTRFLETYPNIHLSYLQALLPYGGPGYTFTTACIGGAQAIGQALALIRSSEADVVLAGGVDSKFAPAFVSGFRRLGMLSTEHDPEHLMRPFDRTRSGMAMSEGAGVLVLEELEHALERGCAPLAELLGFGCCVDGASLTEAGHDGKARAMRTALAAAGLHPDQVDYVNAHGTSTRSNDREEWRALADVLGRRASSIPVNSTKSMLGHTFAACGAIEAVVCVLSLVDQVVHPTRSFEEPDEGCELDIVRGTARKAAIRCCVSNNSAVGGYHASLVLGGMDARAA